MASKVVKNTAVAEDTVGHVTNALDSTTTVRIKQVHTPSTRGRPNDIDKPVIHSRVDYHLAGDELNVTITARNNQKGIPCKNSNMT